MNAILDRLNDQPFIMILSKGNPEMTTKYVITFHDPRTINTFHSSEPSLASCEIVDSMKEVHDYLRWCQLSDGFSTLDEYLTKHPVYIYELPEVRKIKVEGDLT